MAQYCTPTTKSNSVAVMAGCVLTEWSITRIAGSKDEEIKQKWMVLIQLWFTDIHDAFQTRTVEKPVIKECQLGTARRDIGLQETSF